MQDMERSIAMKAKVLLPLLLSVLASPVLASDAIESMFSGPAVQVAQLAPEERRMLRERWEQASPEERMEIRRRLQERVQQASPEEREAGRRRLIERWRDLPREERQRLREQFDPLGGRLPMPPGPGDFAGAVGSFGSGFEQRRPEAVAPEQPDNATNFDPRNHFFRPAGKNRR
jgi:hypothetical protein